MLARKLKEGDLKIPLLGVGGGPGQLSWLVQGCRMEEPQTPLISLGLASSFRGLGGEVNEPLNTSWGQSVRQGCSIFTPCYHTHSIYCPRAKPNEAEGSAAGAVVVEARKQACFGGNSVPFLPRFSLLHSISGHRCPLPQLSSARHSAAAQG